MSPSSSDSWRGGGGADIIDLDRYMRGNVRPSRTLSNDSKLCEQLVVDAGGVSPKLRSIGSISHVSHESYDPDARFKRYSHDSGVSDGSYRRPRKLHRTHRRSSYQDSPKLRMTRELSSARTLSGRANSSSSLRAFRATCEQALIQQQQQISRVAQLCEQLTERAVKTDRNEKSVQNVHLERNACKGKILEDQSEDTSEISSSSRSTKESKDERNKDKHRSQECKTYKIIMNKLDELNQLFKTRTPVRPLQPVPRPHTSSTSVSVCDKLVATDPQRTIIVNRVMTPTMIRGNTAGYKHPPSLGSNAQSSRYSRVTSTRAVTHAFAVDIAPQGLEATQPNIVTESVVKRQSSSDNSQRSKGDPRCGFDLEDPVHLYSQVKRMQAMTATTQRTHSLERVASPRTQLDEHARSARSRSSTRHSPSLCTLCRAYCRYLREWVDPLLGRTDGCKCS